MTKKDDYVYGMDWTKKIENYDLVNYRQYQYDQVAKFIGRDILEVGSGERGFTNQVVKSERNIKKGKIREFKY